MIQYKNMKMQVELKSSDKFTQSENKNEQVKKILTTITFLKLSRRFSPHTKSFEVYKINLLCQSGGSQSAGSSLTRIRAQIFVQKDKKKDGRTDDLRDIRVDSNKKSDRDRPIEVSRKFWLRSE